MSERMDFDELQARGNGEIDRSWPDHREVLYRTWIWVASR